MANTITNLVPDLYEALDVVSREMTGFISGVSMDNSAERAALNQTIYIPETEAQSAEDNTPAQYSPNTGDQTIGTQTMLIDKSRHVPIRWNGEQTRGYRTNGTFSSTLAQQTAQAMRTLVNEVEADIAAEYIKASRAYGTSAATPFSTDLSELANIKKILNDNGAPQGDRVAVLDSAALVNLLNLTNLTQVDAAGSAETLRNGLVTRLFGFDVYESAQVQAHTAGTGTSATTDNAGYAVGATTITLASAGTGTILPGDVITFAGDTNQYVVLSGDADVSGGGTITLAAPGLKQSIAASTTAITVTAAYTANMCFSSSALHLATRGVALPDGGDQAIDAMMITDPRTGMSFEVALYPQFLQNVLHVRLAWGTSLVKPNHAAILKG